jgi:hypothetical protein
MSIRILDLLPKRLDLPLAIGLFLTTLIGLVVRLVWTQQVDTQPVADFAWYFDRAVELSRGMGYHVDGKATAYWPAGYPLALAAVFKFFGAGVGVAKTFNLLLSLACVPLTQMLSMRLFGSRPAAILAGLIVAIHPSFVAYSSILASEPLYTALVLGGCLGLLSAETRWWAYALSGGLLGAAALVRPQAIIIPILVMACAWLYDSATQKDFKFWRSLGIAMLAAIVVMSPWLIRNQSVFGEFVFVSTNGGDNLLIGNHEGADGRYKNPDAAGLERAEGMSEPARDKAARAAAFAYMTDHPLRTIRRWPRKLKLTFMTGTDAAYWGFQKTAGELTIPGAGSDKQQFKSFRRTSQDFVKWLMWALALGVVTAFAANWMKRPGAAFPALPIVMICYAGALGLVFFGNPRFAFPVIPFIAMSAAYGPVAIWSVVHRPKSNQSIISKSTK